MKTRKFTQLLAAFLVVLLFACDKDENNAPKRLKLESIGFSGTLPEGLAFGTTGIEADNQISGIFSLIYGSFVWHKLSVSDTASGITIRIDLPQLKYSNEYLPKTELFATAQKYYPFQLIKEKLAIGNKLLALTSNPDITNGFRVQIADAINHVHYISDNGYDQTGSYLNVINLIEGTDSIPAVGQVKTLQVTFDVDVKVYQTGITNSPSPQKFKGILKMKYREMW